MNNDQRYEIRLSLQDYKTLERYAKFCGMRKSEYLRMLISGYVPKVAPPYNYYLMMKELNAIGNNLNQIAKTANAIDWIDAEKYKIIASLAFEKMESIEKAVTQAVPISEYENGDS